MALAHQPTRIGAGVLRDSAILVVFTVVAALLHVSILVGALIMQYFGFGAQAPMVELPSMEVSMVVLPKSKTQMVHRASKAPSPSGDMQAPAKPRLPDISPPVRQSDLVILKKDAPVETQGQPDRSNERARKLAMLDVLSAPDGAVDQEQSDPNSTTDLSINAGSSGVAADPELARYVATIRDLFQKNFRPLPTIAMSNPEVSCTVRVRFNLDTGVVTDTTVAKPSGNPSWDGAAERAVDSVTKVPIPPEKFREQFAGGYSVVFDANST